MERRKILLVVAAVVAALGATLVFLYARGAESRAVAQFETVEVLSAAQRIERGESMEDALAAGKVTLEPVTVDEVLEGATPDDEAFVGQVALTTVYPGEQLLPVKFGAADEVESTSSLPVPDGKVAIAVSLTDQGRVGSFTRPGSEVAIYLSEQEPKDGSPSYTRMLLPRVTVIGTGSTTQVQSTTTTADGQTVAEQLPNTLLTLAVDQREAEKVLFAQDTGTLSFALLPAKGELEDTGGVRATNLFD
ncbi:MAG: Flp pilus assembly protein CpaB [Actinobacteria bacterium]|nr:Flp pilus assembly protein CpaB [Actinomycetota bacterium]